MPDLPQWLQNIIFGITGLGVGGYTLHRKFKQDSNGDKVDSKTQLLIDSLTNQLNKEREHAAAQLDKERSYASHLGSVIDRVSKERNDAVQALGALQGQITAMGEQIRLLQGEIQKQEKVNSDLNNTVSELRDEVMGMSQRLHTGSQS